MPHKTTSLIPQKRLAMPFHVFRGYPCLWPFVSIRGSYSPPYFFRVFRTAVPYFYEMSAHVLASLAKGDQYRKNTSVTEEKPVFFAHLLAKLRQMCYI